MVGSIWSITWRDQCSRGVDAFPIYATAKVECPAKEVRNREQCLRSKNVGRKIISQSRVLKFFAPHFSTNSFCTFVGTWRHQRAKELVRVGGCKLRFDFLSKAIGCHSFMTSFCLPGCLRPVRSYGPKNQGSAATACSVTFLPALFRQPATKRQKLSDWKGNC